MRVYLLSDHDEHGSDNVVGTTDPAKLPEMLEQGWGKWLRDGDRECLTRALSENAPGKWDLSRGWGGPQLHVIDLT